MAFRNATATAPLASTLYTLYTCPTDYEAVVHAVYISNISPAAAGILVDVVMTPNTTVGAGYVVTGEPVVRILHGTPVPFGASLVFDKPVNLRPGDVLSFSVNAAASGEAFASILLSPVDLVAPN